MKRGTWLIAVLCMGGAGTLAALDRDFQAVGDGKEAPQELTVYRRAAGYSILVSTDGRPAAVTAGKGGKTVFTLSTDGKVTAGGNTATAIPVVREKTLRGYFIPDKISGVRENDLLDVTVQYAGSRAVLPDACGAPLRISGRKGREYNWNLENSTILEQVSNTHVDFTDFRFDVCHESCADLVSGSADVKDGKLLLTAVLRKPENCTMRVLLDSIPGAGYSDGVDFMLDNAVLSRFAGKHARHWKWDDIAKVPFKKDGARYTWEVPLKLIRPEGTGRLKLRFSARNKYGTDEMPSDGKILPVLRPGNLAADPATKMTVSGCYPMYKAYPLTDGQTSRIIHWCFESWAAGEGAEEPVKFVEFRFPKPVPVRQMVIWWEDLPKSAELQILDKEGKWVTVLARKGSGGAVMDWRSAETGAAVPDATREKLKKSEKNVLPFPAGTVTSGVRLQDPKALWIREIEIY